MPGGLEPLGIVGGFLADAEHFGVHPAGIVAVGEALTVEGGVQGIHHGLGDGHLVHRLAVDGGDGGHVFRPLHPAFQFQGDHAHLLQFPQIGDQAVVLQAQGVFFLPVGVAVALAAGLGAAPTVAGAAADHGGHVALAGIAHAQRAMDENFNFNGRVGADIADLLPAQLPAENNPLYAHGGAQQHAGQRMDGHLGTAVDGNAGGNLTAQLHHAQVLHDKGVNIILRGIANQLRRLGHLPVGDQGIEGQVNLHAPDMAVFNGLHQRLGSEVFCALPRVECAAAQIHGVSAVLNGRAQSLH